MKRLVISLFCLLFLLSQPAMAYENEINSMSTGVAEKIAASGKSKIAVVDFTDLQGNVTELGRFIAEEFSVALLGKSEKFRIVDRTHLKSLIKEHKLSETGLIDPKTAKKLGEIAGVDALITGTITPFGENIRISVKVLDVSTAMLVAANNGNIAATEGIKMLMASGIGDFQTNSASAQIRREKPVAPDNTSTSSANQIVSVFQGTDTEGWEIQGGKFNNPDGGGSGGGSGNGCLVSIDISGQDGYFVAPSDFHGDWRAYKELRFDLWASGGEYYNKDNGVEYYDVIIKSGFSTANYRLPEKPSSTWKTYVIPLNSDKGWTFVEGATTLSDVLVNVTEFKIRAEYGIGADKAGLDNVELVP